MRAFFESAGSRQTAGVGVADHTAESLSVDVQAAPTVPRPLTARVAVYDSGLAAPRVVDVAADSPAEFIDRVANTVYRYAREAGGTIPFSAVRELAENLIHAGFCEPVVSILDDGRTIRFADQGPGISDKERAVLPGFTTATLDMKAHIRGVGSGLPIVREFVSASGGSLLIEDNLGCGAVVTIAQGAGAHARIPAPAAPAPAVVRTPAPMAQPTTVPTVSSDSTPAELPGLGAFRVPQRLSARQKRVLALVMEGGTVGPTIVARELSIALSTAHRDLATLESLGFIESGEDGKRSLTTLGESSAEDLLR